MNLSDVIVALSESTEGERRLVGGVANMASSMPFCKFLSGCFDTERVGLYDLRGEPLEQLPAHLARYGIVKISADDTRSVIEVLGAAGALPTPQYEAVAANLPDLTELVTVARVTPTGTTSAFKAADTLLHQDGYQFPSPYLGAGIAGGGFMPDVEVLAFPKVVERRALVFADLPAACRAMVRSHGSGLLELLGQPIFGIDPKYRHEDPRLAEEAPFSVIYRDELGFRFRLGGSVQTTDPQAAFALSLFRMFAQSTVLVELLESGTAFVINQRIIAHSGIRIPGVDGLTELRRTLLRFDRDEVRR
jgi:hypothetical protein